MLYQLSYFPIRENGAYYTITDFLSARGYFRFFCRVSLVALISTKSTIIGAVLCAKRSSCAARLTDLRGVWYTFAVLGTILRTLFFDIGGDAP